MSFYVNAHGNSGTAGSSSSITITATPWTRKLTLRERLRYLWTAIRGKETIR